MSVIDPDYATLNPSLRKQGSAAKAYFPVVKALYRELLYEPKYSLDYNEGYLMINVKRVSEHEVKTGWWIFSKYKTVKKTALVPAISIMADSRGIVIAVLDPDYAIFVLASQLKTRLERKYLVDNVGIVEY